MAREGTELPIPRNEGEEDNVGINIEPVVEEEVRVHRECYEEKYRLKVPTFSGEEPVEQFVQEFQDVMEVAQWPPQIALLKLRMALSDKAKPYGMRPDIDGIFASCVLVSPLYMRGPVSKDCGVILTRRYKSTLPR